MTWMVPWTAFVVVVETARLYIPALNNFLLSPFTGMARPEEFKHYSGIFHTTVGVFILFALFGAGTRIVTASLFYVALGDTAAALVGKSFGRHKIMGGKKSWEGAFGCLAVCAAAGLACGFNVVAVLASSAVACIIEALPTNPYFNDNVWMPIGAAVVLKLLG
jgi:dolichol kinase